MKSNLESIPTHELIEKARRTPIEKAVFHSGFFLALGAIFGSWVAVFWIATANIIPGLMLCLLSSILLPLVVFSTTKFLGEFRGRSFLVELDRRFGRWNIPAYVRFYKERLEPNAIMCVFRGRALPNGRRYWGCVHLDELGMMNLKATASDGIYLGMGPDPWSETEAHDRELVSNEREEICELIEKTKGTGKSHITTRVRDGFPASVAVIFGDGSKVTFVSSNLCGLSEVQESDDRIRLLELMAKVVCNHPRFVADKA